MNAPGMQMAEVLLDAARAKELLDDALADLEPVQDWLDTSPADDAPSERAHYVAGLIGPALAAVDDVMKAAARTTSEGQTDA